MASGRMEFHARTIMQHANFTFVLPNDVEMEEVFDKKHYEREPMNIILLHGLTGTDTDWLYGGVAQEMAIQYNLNVFMPTTGNSFYLNKGYEGADYSSFIGEELPEYIHKTFGIKMKRENTMIGGLSMGGYGTLHTAFAYPDRFFACIALSSAIHVKDIASSAANEVTSVVPREMLLDIFGDPDKLLESDKNPAYQYARLKEAGAEIPKVYLACGTEDSLITANRDFRDFLESEGADYIYDEGPGKHNWTFWNEYLNRGLACILSGQDK
ncbi:MAG: acetylesterase [Mogibacterium sp.]|nr:acetylesterase [Mogibacterium sp.]